MCTHIYIYTHTLIGSHTQVHTLAIRNTHTHARMCMRVCVRAHRAKKDIVKNIRGYTGLKKVGLNPSFKGCDRRAVMESDRARI